MTTPTFDAPGLTDAQPAAGAPDEETPDLSVGSLSTDLADLAAELAPITTETVDLEVPLRPGYSVRCRTDFTGLDLDKWRKAARDKKFIDGIDTIKLAALLIGATCTAILKGGREVLSDGAVVTFATAEFRGQLGTTVVEQAVRRFYGQEGHVDAAGRRLLNEAGWGEEVYVVDPTTPTPAR